MQPFESSAIKVALEHLTLCQIGKEQSTGEVGVEGLNKQLSSVDSRVPASTSSRDTTIVKLSVENRMFYPSPAQIHWYTNTPTAGNSPWSGAHTVV
jgi:hypothetical protein